MWNDPERDCHVDPVDREVDPAALERASVAMLAVSGMGCQSCANRVRNALVSEPGVLAADIELFRGMARVRFDPVRVDARDLVQAVTGAGGDGRHEYRATILSAGPGTGPLTR